MAELCFSKEKIFGGPQITWKSDPTPQDPAAVLPPSNFSLSDFRAIINCKALVIPCECVCVLV